MINQFVYLCTVDGHLFCYVFWGCKKIGTLNAIMASAFCTKWFQVMTVIIDLGG